MSGMLYVVGTPIGNLEDITLRQIRILSQVDFIAAEDTRVTRKLLNHLELKTPTMSYHEHSGSSVAQTIADRILAGESCAVVTDAGMPCISDPGEPLVRLCRQQGIPVTVVPGPSAAIAALAVSGQHTAQFTFEGFLSVNQKQRISHLERLCGEQRTMIFYEAPHKLLRTLSDFQTYFGADRPLSVCRELTKLHEEVLLTTVSEALSHYEQVPPKGEFVLVLAGAQPLAREEQQRIPIEEAAAQVQALAKGGMRLPQACKQVAQETGYRKSQLYEQVSGT